MEQEKNFILTRIQQFLDERSWSIYKLAKESQLPYSSLNNIFVRNTIPSVVTLEKICTGLGITLMQFFDEKTKAHQLCGNLSDDELRVVTMYRRLDDESKKLVEAYLMGLAKSLP